MNSVLINLLISTFRASDPPKILIKYITVLGLMLAAAWPVSDALGRSAPPGVFMLIAFVQGITIPFLTNSFVSARIELPDRIKLEDWIYYTPVPIFGIFLAYIIWSSILCTVLMVMGLPFTVMALPVAGDTAGTLLRFIGCLFSLNLLFAVFAFGVSAIISIEWLTPALIDSCLGLVILMSMSGITSFDPSVKGRPVELIQYAGPLKAIKAALVAHSGLPWEILIPLAAAGILAVLSITAASVVRGQRGEVQNA